MIIFALELVPVPLGVFLSLSMMFHSRNKNFLRLMIFCDIFVAYSSLKNDSSYSASPKTLDLLKFKWCLMASGSMGLCEILTT